MKITMKLYASLGPYLPPGAEYNTVTIDVADDASILDVLDHHNVPRESCHLVLVNGVFKPPGARGPGSLQDGDALAVWPPVAGG